MGDISGVMEGGIGREPSDVELSGGVICDGVGSAFAALFGVLPNTSFSQNVGLVAMTKVVNRMALASGAVFLVLCGLVPKLGALVSIMPQAVLGGAAAVFLVLCGLVPKLGALVSIMPQAVLGGAAVMMFSSIVISGIQLITKEKMTARNLTIVSVALGVGYGMGATPNRHQRYSADHQGEDDRTQPDHRVGGAGRGLWYGCYAQYPGTVPAVCSAHLRRVLRPISWHSARSLFSSSAASPALFLRLLWRSCSTCCCRKKKIDPALLSLRSVYKELHADRETGC